MVELDRLLALSERFSQATLLVVGDMMLDRFVKGTVTRISPEAPVPVVRVTEESAHPGGAANVIANIRDLGGHSLAVGLLGSDPQGEELARKLIGELGVEPEGLIRDDGFQTIQKTRIVAHRQQVVRVDREGDLEPAAETRRKIQEQATRLARRAQAIIVSDYGKGLVDPNLLATLAELNAKTPVSVDPKDKNFKHYRDFQVITPNQKEAEGMSGVAIDGSEKSVRRAAARIFERLRCRNLLITLGDRGMALFETPDRTRHIETEAREVFDVSGAGDTVIAVYTLAGAVGATPLEAAIMANAAAGVVVGKLGTATVSPDELRQALHNWAARQSRTG